MSSWFRKDKSENILVIHIDSASVGLSIMQKSHGVKASIIYKIRVNFENRSAGAKPTEETMFRALDQVLEHFSVDGFKKLGGESDSRIKQVLVALSPPWVESSLNTAPLRSDKSFVLNKRTIHEAIEKSEEALRASSKEKEVFGTTFLNLEANGYKVTTLDPQKVPEADISFLANISDRTTLHTIQEKVGETLHFDPRVTFQGFMFIFYTVLSSVYQNLHSSLLINITDEETEILFVEHGNPRLLTSMNMGPLSLVRRIAEEFKIDLSIAESYVRLFTLGMFDPNVTMKLDKIISAEKVEWKKLWDKKSEKLPSLAKSPYAIFLSTAPKHRDTSKLFLEDVLPNKNIVILGQDNKFTSLITKSPEGEDVDENLAIVCFYDTII